MSLEKKSVHVRLSPEMHHRLTTLSGLSNNDIAEHANYLLEKMIVAEWHTVSIQIERMEKMGLIGKKGD